MKTNLKSLLIRLYVWVIILFVAPSVMAEDSNQALKVEREGLTIAQELCADSYECKALIESYDDAAKDPDPSGRFITFTALAIYIEQTLAPKLQKTEETQKKLTRMHTLFEERQGL